MADLTWTMTAPYMECTACRHPGPPVDIAAVTIAQPHGAEGFHLIPHLAGCPAPNPFNGPSATVTFGDSSAVTARRVELDRVVVGELLSADEVRRREYGVSDG